MVKDMNPEEMIILCQTDVDYTQAMQVTEDYIAWLNMDLSF